MIICAAIKIVDTFPVDELIVCGHRHADCFKIISNLDNRWKNVPTKIQGFINHKGEFLNRKAAFEHAKECGQLCVTTCWYKEDHNQDELYSEDLY